METPTEKQIDLPKVTLADLDADLYSSEQLKQWDIDFLADKGLPQRQFSMIFGIFKDYALFSDLKVSEAKLLNFLSMLYYLYEHNKNPFHNFTHAVTIL